MTLETEIYQILKKHKLGLKKREELIVDLLDFINKREEAITVTRCCESDSEQLICEECKDIVDAIEDDGCCEDCSCYVAN